MLGTNTNEKNFSVIWELSDTLSDMVTMSCKLKSETLKWYDKDTLYKMVETKHTPKLSSKLKADQPQAFLLNC